MVEVYTDGAFSSSRNQGGWAFVALQDGVRIHSNFDVIEGGTNNRAEIISVIEAIKYMQEVNINKFTIYSDSMYVIGTMTLNYKRNKNTDLWEELDKLVLNKQIDFKHVKGHNGDKFNTLCDTLAVAGSHLLIGE